MGDHQEGRPVLQVVKLPWQHVSAASEICPPSPCHNNTLKHKNKRFKILTMLSINVMVCLYVILKMEAARFSETLMHLSTRLHGVIAQKLIIITLIYNFQKH
jgi:hypothetical protein